MDTTEADDDDEGGVGERRRENEATSMDATSVRGRLHRLSVIGRRGTADWLAATDPRRLTGIITRCTTVRRGQCLTFYLTSTDNIGCAIHVAKLYNSMRDIGCKIHATFSQFSSLKPMSRSLALGMPAKLRPRCCRLSTSPSRARANQPHRLIRLNKVTLLPLPPP